MKRGHIHAVTLLVPEYQDGLDFFVGKLGFDLVEDTDLGNGKRWVLIRPPEATETHILLARATTDAQRAAIGKQSGDRVGFFLSVSNFDAHYIKMRDARVEFEEEPRNEPYGIVAVFRDAFGNRWDLLEFHSAS